MVTEPDPAVIAAQGLLRDPRPSDQLFAAAQDHARNGDYRMAYFKLCETIGTLQDEIGGDKLRQIYDVIHCIYDTCEDENDRIYLGSTNDHHTLNRQLRALEKLLSRNHLKGTP